ncbi:MAG: choice-of-anchor B family protein [Chitinophagales bacterium]|nr:choice-of-anchor B family protein [Chitinophagales bacterium]
MKKIILLTSLLFIFLSISKAQNFNFTFRGEVTYPYSCASVWGYVDDSGIEYALVGTNEGVSIVDVSDPDNPAIKFNVKHTPNLWREIKTYGQYAYVTNEGGDGLQIIDLSYLPDSVRSSSFIYTDSDGNTQANGHTLWIDENGRLYIFGGGYSNGGATIFDLTADPLNPTYLGSYEQHYIHDGYVRGDTLWASEIYEGTLEIVDVSDPSNCIPLASVTTPNHFTHNSWPTHDNNYVFTTDEVNDSYLTSYDVSDLSNITELDRVQSNPGSQAIIHNVHLYNDQFAVAAYYKDGVVLFDVSQPDNMIEVGSYDTDPGESGGDYGGTWGVYPYLPSGNILATDLSDAGEIGGKLTIITPSYISASWLEGTVTDLNTGAIINDVYVEILSTTQNDYTDLSGIYKTGTGMPGTYTVRFSKIGYETQEIQNVSLSSGVTTILDVQLVPLGTITATGVVLDSLTNSPVANAQVFLRGVSNGLNFTVTTDSAGAFNIPSIFEDAYDVFAGKWGYHEKGVSNIALNSTSAPLEFKITPGYYDDFILDNGWTVTGAVATGMWERGEPVGTFDNGTPYNPESDVTNDWGDYCFVTDNAGGDAGDYDVDNGITTLTSPMMDLSDYADPVVSFYSWFVNGGGSGFPNDTLKVYLTDGITSINVAKIKFPMSLWVYHEFHVNEFLTPNTTMQVYFEASDDSSGHLVEAAIDLFRAEEAQATGIVSEPINSNCCTLYPNPFSDESSFQFDFGTRSVKNSRFEIYNSVGQMVESHLIDKSKGKIVWGSSLKPGMYIAKVLNDGVIEDVMPLVKIN